MKQTAVEWLKMQLEIRSGIKEIKVDSKTFEELCEQAKEMEKQQSDNFAIEFADWCNYGYTKLHSVWCPIFGDQRDNSKWKNTEELLEIFKELFANTGIEPTTDESGNTHYNFKATLKEEPNPS